MKYWPVFLFIVCLVMAAGCSGGADILSAPDNSTTRDLSTTPSHQLWGLYQFVADPVAETLDIIPLRAVEMHLNALPFLEPPPLLNLTLESLAFNGNIIDADIGLRHPFLGLTEFTGFDVCGILISSGSAGGFSDPDLLMPGPDDLHLVNPDGYTRWWNPAEFPVNTGTMFGYNDGLLGAPDSYADFSATLNGYKYFCDDIDDPTGDLSEVDPEGRGIFSAGQKNVRRFTIDMAAAGLIFNYAIDANWVFPDGAPPWEAPADFGVNANRPEPWNILITETENTLWYDGVDNGGDLSLSIDVYDWFNADMNTVTVESPGNFTLASSAVALTGGVGYSTYEIDILDANPTSTPQIDLFITVECEAVDYGGMLTGKTQAVYFTSPVAVDDEAPPIVDEWPEEWACFQYNAANIGRNPNIQNFDHEDYSQTWYAPLSGTYKMGGPAITEDYVYTVTLGGAYSTSSNHFMYCLNINNSGAAVWYNNINPTGEYGRGMTSPVWFDDGEDNRIVVGGDRIWCFDALTGDVEWEYGESYTCTRPNLKFYNDRIYIALGGAIHCINAFTGANVWTSVGPITSSETTPAVVNDRVYFCNGANFTCLDADTGDVLWQTASTEGQSHWDGPLVVNGRVYLATYQQGLRCLDADDGTLYWTLDPGSDPYITGLTYWIDDDENVIVYMGSAYSSTGCIAVKDNGSTGSILWQSAAHYFDGSPVFNEGVVYIGDTSGTLYGYDCATGAVVFTQAISGGIRNAIGFAFGRMIVPARNGVYCFETE